MTAVLELSGVGFAHGALPVLGGLDLTVAPGEFLACVGPSGSGKSTLLALLGGHLSPGAGRLERRGTCRTIFQDGGLLPWLTVRENLEAGAPRAATAAERRGRADAWLATTALAEFAGHYPHQLSGGMRQRVELGRALAGDAEVLLLDEPFSALDYQTRLRMRRELAATLATTPRTVVLVTHDLEEAVQLADRIVVLGGRPATIQRELRLPPGRPRAPTDPGVAETLSTLLAAVGL